MVAGSHGCLLLPDKRGRVACMFPLARRRSPRACRTACPPGGGYDLPLVGEYVLPEAAYRFGTRPLWPLVFWPWYTLGRWLLLTLAIDLSSAVTGFSLTNRTREGMGPKVLVPLVKFGGGLTLCLLA